VKAVCEGCWCIYNDKGSAAVIESKDQRILRESAEELGRRGFHPFLYEVRWNSGAGVDGKARLELRRRKEIRALAEKLLPISRHPEKIAKMRLVLESAESTWTRIRPKVRAFKDFVEIEVSDFTTSAEIQYNMSRRGTFGKGSSARL